MSVDNDNYDRIDARRMAALELVVMGGSAGALQPLLELIEALPADFHLPLVLVLHLPERGESRLVELFQQRSARQVCQPQDKQWLELDHLYIAGRSYHLAIERDRRFSVTDEAPVHFSRPSIDVLFGSAADAFGDKVAAVIFSCASNDGAAGLARIAAAGGLTVVQSPDDAAFPAMPRAASASHRPWRVATYREMPTLFVAMGRACSC